MTEPSKPVHALRWWERDLIQVPGLDRFAKAARTHFEKIADTDRLSLATAMTCLLLVFHSPHVSPESINLLAAAGLIYKPWRHTPLFWLVMFVLRVCSQLPGHWWQIDNHQYLINWWLLALAIGFLFRRQTTDMLALSARLLIGFCFAFATLWKIVARDFIDGTFLQWTIMHDRRFSAFAESVLGVRNGGTDQNRTALEQLLAAPDIPQIVTSSEWLPAAALTMTWWTVLIEATIALCYLWPGDRGPARFRSAALFVFAGTTYLLAPVTGFARVLLALSVVAASRRDRWWIVTAILLFLLVTLFHHLDGPLRMLSEGGNDGG